MPTFNVLSFPGGGVRGVFTARLLQRLVALYPTLLAETSLFAGTSTGGILALGLAHGLSPAALVQLYRDHAPRIFTTRFAGGLWNAKYDAAGLRAVLTETFGEATLGELGRHVLVPALDLDAPERPGRARGMRAKFFKSWDATDGRLRCVDVAVAGGAAPTYFESAHVEGNGQLVDGGLVANDPCVSAAADALRLGARHADLRVLSVGTGSAADFIEGGDWGIAQWATKAVGAVLAGTADTADYQLTQFLGDAYHRIDAVLPRPVELDAVGEVEALVAMADAVDLGPTVAWLRLTRVADGTGPLPDATRKTRSASAA